jgi:hypothetical protein
MKIFKRTILSAFMLALIFSFAGCHDGSPAAGDSIVPQKEALAKLVVSVDGARTLAPDAAGFNYRLVITNAYDQTVKYEAPIDGSTVTQDLEPGYWNVGVWAYTGEDLGVGWADEDVTLAAGETKNVSLTVLPITGEEAAATFTWNFVLPEDEALGASIEEATLTPFNPNSASGGMVWLGDGGSLELPAGRYILDVTVGSNRYIQGNLLKTVRKEVVYLYPRLTTNALYTFTAADFGADVYFTGVASINYPTGVEVEYTPTQVQLQLAGYADDTTKIATAPITLYENEEYPDDPLYVWELSEASNAIADYLSSARFRFKAIAPGGKELYSRWQNVSLSSVTGRTEISLTADVYKITVSDLLKGGAIEVNTEAAVGDMVRMTIKPDQYYGVDQTTIYPLSAQRVEGAAGVQYVFAMPNSDITPSVKFFRLQGTVSIGSNTAGYKPVKIEAFEEGVDYEWLKIGEANIALVDSNYEWRIDPASYVYTNDGLTTGSNRNIAFKITLESADGNTTYTSETKRNINSLHDESTYNVYITPNKLSTVYSDSEALTAASVKIIWNQEGWATVGYKVERSSDGFSWSQIGTVIPFTAEPTASYIDTDLSAAYTYYYRVTGITQSGDGTPSDSATVQTRYETPIGVNASFQGGYPLRNSISWNSVSSGQYSYTVYYDVYRNGEQITSFSTSNNYYDSNVDFGQTYTYTVVAHGSDGKDSAQSTASNTVSTPYLNEIGTYSYVESYISAGEYQYFRVNDANWNYSLFYLDYTDADIYVQAGYVYSFPDNYTSYYSDYSGGYLSFSNYGYPVIVCVRGNGSPGSYGFQVGQN